jgi:hypothetical protein
MLDTPNGAGELAKDQGGVYVFRLTLAPEIVVEHPAGMDISSGAAIDFGIVDQGSSANRTFTIRNTGDVDLTNLAITIDGPHASEFTVTAVPAESLAGPDGVTAFTVMFSPGSAGEKTASIHIVSNDPDENPFAITLRGSTPMPEIVVEHSGGRDLADSSAVILGNCPVGFTASKIFTVRNVGIADLDMTLSVDGPDSSDFAIDTGEMARTLPPGGATTFTLIFTPAADTPRTATLHIGNNDFDESSFDLVLEGQNTITREFNESEGIAILPRAPGNPYPSTISVSGVVGPIIAVRVKLNGLTHSYPDNIDAFLVGSTGAVAAVMSDAGGASAMNNWNLVFDDTALLPIPDGTFFVPGSFRPANYEPGELRPPGGTGSIGTNLTALAGAGANGSWKLYIDNDNLAAGSLQSWAIVIDAAPLANDIAVEQPAGLNIVDGGSKSFGSVMTGQEKSLTFTVRNMGMCDLRGLAITMTGADAAEFVLMGAPAAPLSGPDGTATFAVRFSPATVGPKTALLHIVSDDPDENPFDITLTGAGITPQQAWRLQYFGTIANSGNGADLSDPDKDGIVNLMEFVTAQNPLKTGTVRGAILAGPAGLELTFFRSNASLASGVQCFVEWSDSLASQIWTTEGAVETIVTDDGGVQEVKITVPASPAGRRFVRLRAVSGGG